MSEDAANVTYLVVVFTGCGSAAVRISALRRGFSTSLVVIISCHAAGICAFLAAVPLVYRTIDASFGRPDAATLVVHSFIIVFSAHAHLLATVWAAEVRGRQVSHRRVTALVGSYTVILAAMVWAFRRAAITGPEHPLTFNRAYAGDPSVVFFLTLFMVGLAYSMLSAAWACRQGLRTSNLRLRKGLRDISVAALFIFGYVVFAGPSLAAAATGHHPPDRLTELGTLSGTAGAFVLNWAFTGPVIQVWWRDRSDYRRLRVLWETAVEGAGRTVALAPPSRTVERWSLLSAGAWLLVRRLADICDAERALSPWMDPGLARAVEDAAGPRTTAEELRALAGAAMLLDAVRRRGRGEPPAFEALPRPDDVAPDRERTHLVRVARSLDHPMVLAALDRHTAPH